MIIDECIGIPESASPILLEYLQKGYILDTISLYYNDKKETTLYLSKGNNDVKLIFVNDKFDVTLEKTQINGTLGWDANGSPIEE